MLFLSCMTFVIFKVHELHAKGQEIALHSITHENSNTYWQSITLEQLREEFGGERELIAHFADIPIEDMQGVRLPFLQLSGDNFSINLQSFRLN